MLKSNKSDKNIVIVTPVDVVNSKKLSFVLISISVGTKLFSLVDIMLI